MDVGNYCPNYRAIPADKKIALTLYYLAHTGCLLLMTNVFGMDRSTASKVVRTVCRVITRELPAKYIHMPATLDEMQQTVAQFEVKYNMPQAFGAIDGTHIRILAPAKIRALISTISSTTL